MKRRYIIISSLAACILLYFIEQFLQVNYGVKTISKIILFTLIPYIYIAFLGDKDLYKAVNVKKIDKRHLKLGFIFGVSSFFIILVAYSLLGHFIDFQSITEELQNKSKITPGNFALIGAYVTFGNSFLEEFFFRGFIFLNLYKLKYKKTAYIYSSLLFGLYHIAIFKTWFSLWITILVLLGLIVVGFVFNWLDTKSENFINSWILHIMADSAIILIGFKVFHMF